LLLFRGVQQYPKHTTQKNRSQKVHKPQSQIVRFVALFTSKTKIRPSRMYKTSVAAHIFPVIG